MLCQQALFFSYVLYIFFGMRCAYSETESREGREIGVILTNSSQSPAHARSMILIKSFTLSYQRLIFFFFLFSKLVRIVHKLFILLYGLYPCMFLWFNKSLHRFPVFLTKYKDFRGSLQTHVEAQVMLFFSFKKSCGTQL